jgi:hypothetical protein
MVRLYFATSALKDTSFPMLPRDTDVYCADFNYDDNRRNADVSLPLRLWLQLRRARRCASFPFLLFFSTLIVTGVDSSKNSENFRGRRPAAC